MLIQSFIDAENAPTSHQLATAASKAFAAPNQRHNLTIVRRSVFDE
jgi:hypothetical protein